MGGCGSGEYSRDDTKRLISSALALDVRKLKKDNLLNPGIQFDSTWDINGNILGAVTVKVYEGYLILEYTYCKTEQIIQEISFAWTLCNYGGVRLWFRCPSCGYRVAVIYGVEKVFACRKCHNLNYASCNMSEYQRLFLKADKLKQKIGGKPGIINPIPNKPKGMHRNTYDRLRTEIELLLYVGLTKMNSRFKR